MRFNDHALRRVAKEVRPEKEGRLNYRAPRDSKYNSNIIVHKHCSTKVGSVLRYYGGVGYFLICYD